MSNNLKNLQSLFYPLESRITAIFLLWTFLVILVAPVFSLAGSEQAPEGMVYCPLSRKFQPVHPPAQEEKELQPFGEICASRETKDFLFQKIIVRNSLKKIYPNENKLDELAFDFLAHGESVLKKLPDFPNFPSENLIRQIGSGIVITNTYEHRLAWKEPLQYVSSTLLARPPTVLTAVFFTNKLIHRSDELSRRIAPRAPPAAL